MEPMRAAAPLARTSRFANVETTFRRIARSGEAAFADVRLRIHASFLSIAIGSVIRVIG
jgi:hypothetical protein